MTEAALPMKIRYHLRVSNTRALKLRTVSIRRKTAFYTSFVYSSKYLDFIASDISVYAFTKDSAYKTAPITFIKNIKP